MFQKYHAQAQDSNTIGEVWLRNFFAFPISGSFWILQNSELEASRICPCQRKEKRRAAKNLFCAPGSCG
jgi:hypothetical protein